ncbi:hypothetical protein D9758_010410 [Tetrapyrgos nigripes]|uniref:Zn(2)-C6 fungal-type domain-containing protein n=1 Tax=Tetrapyrgos nigripes TaxID=182062 RepID=A0A8H5CNK5_9AGAR|nr:hypothetical protein D9758_010410 [Tetrapyrgos nigripes]
MSNLKDPRGRRLQACDECRRRKVRCDASNMPDNICTQCRNASVSCTHTNSGLKRGPKLGSSRPFASQPIRILIDDILKGSASESFYLLDDKDTVWKLLTKIANHVVSLEQKLERCQREHHVLSEVVEPAAPTSDIQTTYPIEDGDGIDSMDSLSNEFSRFRLGVPKKIHFGDSSHMMLVMTALEHRRELDSGLEEWQSLLLQTKRPEFWNVPTWLTLPEPDVPVFAFPEGKELQTLVNAYFTQNNVFCPLLHRPSFERSVSEGLHLQDSAFGALLLSVCAVGSRYTYLPSDSDGSDPIKSGIKWFNQLPIKQSAFGQSVSLYHLQMYCLASVYLNMVTGPDVGWMLSGIAMRLAQERGTHRRTSGNQKPTLEGELWKRVFWTLVITDTETSMLFGRPSATSTQDFDVGLPVDCDDEYWEHETPDLAFKQPPGQPSLVAFWNCYLTLVEIIGFARQSLYAVRKSEFSVRMGFSGQEWHQKAVMELDSALNKWIDSVPSHLRWDAQAQNNTFFSQSAILHSMYYWVQIQIHRKFIPRPGQKSTLSFPSLAICANAARSCIRVVETYFKQRFLSFGHFMHPLFGSAMVLAVNLWRERQSNVEFNARSELVDIYKCIDMIRLYESRYPLAGRLIDIINTVMSVSRYPPLLVSTPKEIGSDQAPWPDIQIPQASSGPEPSLFHQPSYGDADPARNIVIGEHGDMNLPFYSSELGQLPVHAAPNLGYDFSSPTNEELAIFGDGTQRTVPQNTYLYAGPSQGQSQLVNEFMNQPSTAMNPVLTDAYPIQYRFPAVGLNTENQNWSQNELDRQDWDIFIENVQQLLPTVNASENHGPWMHT